ncbi:MAG TPA: hypothetical protein VEC16_05665 [Alphaproteobacteria bacterium]|nr:hypothetical protein [Alphaproteobacteria bacterium]
MVHKKNEKTVRKNRYVHNAVVTCAGVAGYAVLFVIFGFDIFHSFDDLLIWTIVLFGILLAIILLEELLRKITRKRFDTDSIGDGLWVSIALYCWSQIGNIDWKTNFWDAIGASSVYFLIGAIVLVFGYIYAKSRK